MVVNDLCHIHTKHKHKEHMKNSRALFLVPTLLSLLALLNGMIATVEASKTKVHIVYLGERPHGDPKLLESSHHDMLAKIIGGKRLASESMVYSYKHGFSGFAAKLTDSQARKLADSPGVVRIVPNTLHSLQTTRSWDHLGLSSHSHTNLLLSANMGDGVIIGVFDTGIWPEAKSFNDEGLGPIPPTWKGECQSGDQFNGSTNCNKKLIGARWFIDGFLAEYGKPLNTSAPESIEFMSPRDAHGHGTHTASTAAGSLVANVSYKGLGRGTVRGGAPRARLAVYKVCWNVNGGICSSADILAAHDAAIHDGVDVISMSIGNFFPSFPEVDARNGIAVGSFHAVANGIVVVSAAGNAGPEAQILVSTAPWLLTVAASTIDRGFPATITLGNNKTLLGQSMFTGKEIGFTGLVFPETVGLLTSAPPNDCQYLSINGTEAEGKVVLCFLSVANNASAIISASLAVKAAGGVGLIVAKNPTNVLYPWADGFPCVEVDFGLGTQIVSYIRSIRSPVVKLSPAKTFVGKPITAKIASFSSRGPNVVAPEILKPDIAAPGVNILAATSPLDPWGHNGYAMHTGTSMAAPHAAGIVALIKASHPTWSPAAIRSALVTSALRNGPSGGFRIFAEGSPRKLADPFDYGGGIVDPNQASNPGLVYDMGKADYLHYLCSMGYNNSAISHLTMQASACPSTRPSILDVNLPSITIPALRRSLTVTRTVTNVGDTESVYRAGVEPPFGVMVSVKPGVLVFNSTIKKLSFSVTVTTTQEENAGYSFGSLTWSDGKHHVRSPLSVRTEILPFFY